MKMASEDDIRELEQQFDQFNQSRQEQNEAESRSRLERLLAAMHTGAHSAHSARVARRCADLKRRWLEMKESAFASAPARKIVGYLVLNMVYPAAYIIDVVLLSLVAQDMVRSSSANKKLMAIILCVVLPLAILLCEIAIQEHWADLREKAAGFSPALLVAGLAAVVVMLIMPAMIASAEYMRQQAVIAASGGKTSARTAALLSLTVFNKAATSLMVHGLVLLGGLVAREAKAFLFFKLTQLKLQRESRRQNERFARRAQDVANDFRSYWHGLDDHNRRFINRPVTAGPFDKVTRELINERAGHEVILPPTGPGGDGADSPASYGPPTGGQSNPPVNITGSAGGNGTGTAISPQPPSAASPTSNQPEASTPASRPSAATPPPAHAPQSPASTAKTVAPVAAPAPGASSGGDGGTDGLLTMYETILSRVTRDNDDRVQR
jgi:hypothetical protein